MVLVAVVDEGAGGCEGVFDTAGVGFVVDVVIVVAVVGCEGTLLACWVAPAAAAEYRIGVNVGGRGCWGRPALRILDIGCCAKFGGGGGFATGTPRSVAAGSILQSGSHVPRLLKILGPQYTGYTVFGSKDRVNSLLCVVTGAFFKTGLPSRLLAIESSSDFRCSGVRGGRSAAKISINFKRARSKVNSTFTRVFRV